MRISEPEVPTKLLPNSWITKTVREGLVTHIWSWFRATEQFSFSITRGWGGWGIGGVASCQVNVGGGHRWQWWPRALGGLLLKYYSSHFLKSSKISPFVSVLSAMTLGQAIIISCLNYHNGFFLPGLPGSVIAPFSLQSCPGIHAGRIIFLKYIFVMSVSCFKLFNMIDKTLRDLVPIYLPVPPPYTYPTHIYLQFPDVLISFSSPELCT